MKTDISSIFLVVLCFGEYDDEVRAPIRSFGTKGEADYFQREETSRINLEMGKREAIYSLVCEWEKGNPCPTLPDEGNVSDAEYESHHVAYSAWMALRDAEDARLCAIVGINTNELMPRDEGFCLYVREVPFGSPRTSVDLAQAAE